MSTGFSNHVRMAFTHDAQALLVGDETNYDKNKLEKAGDLLAYHAVHGPTKLAELSSDPKIITVVLTILAMSSVQWAFYPIRTFNFTKRVCNLLADIIPAWSVKFTIYITLQSAILGMGTRALGRFTNAELMQKWRAPQAG